MKAYSLFNKTPYIQPPCCSLIMVTSYSNNSLKIFMVTQLEHLMSSTCFSESEVRGLICFFVINSLIELTSKNTYFEEKNS